LRFKILLREDIWRSLKFENKSHLFGRSVPLKWHDKVAFIKVALKQALQSPKFKKLQPSLGKTRVDDWNQQDVYFAWNLLVGERMKVAFLHNRHFSKRHKIANLLSPFYLPTTLQD
jgi:hypothetical protein